MYDKEYELKEVDLTGDNTSSSSSSSNSSSDVFASRVSYRAASFVPSTACTLSFSNISYDVYSGQRFAFLTNKFRSCYSAYKEFVFKFCPKRRKYDLNEIDSEGPDVEPVWSRWHQPGVTQSIDGFEQCCHCFGMGKSLCACFRNTKKRRRILRHLSGTLNPGDMCALIGASGAGKTTLLQILSRRLRKNRGIVKINDEMADDTDITKLSCYVTQSDLFFQHLTVEEHLQEQAKIRVPLSKEDAEHRAQQVLRWYGLEKSRNTRIGTAVGISGGEKKRLNIASQLLTNAPIVFADEPTSGLDAFMAFIVIKLLRNLADSGHTVVAVVHQPSTEAFAMFNKVMVLAEGRCVYFGPRTGLVPYFAKLGYPCSPFMNVSDFVLDLMTIQNVHNLTIQEKAIMFKECWTRGGREFVDALEGGKGTANRDKLIEAGSKWMYPPLSPEELAAAAAKEDKELERFTAMMANTPSRVSSWTAFSGMLHRCMLQNSRDMTVMRARVVQTCITGLISSIVYWRLSYDDPYSKAGATYFVLQCLGFVAVYSVATLFINEKQIIAQEKADGLYKLPVYFWAKMLSDFAFNWHLPILLLALTWWGMGLNDNVGKFFEAMGLYELTHLALSPIGYIVASAVPSASVALAVIPILMLPCLICSGFIVNFNSLPPFWVWLKVLSPFRWGFEAILITVLDNPECDAIPDCASALADYGFTKDNLGLDIGVLIVQAILGRFLAMVLLMWNMRKKDD